MSLDHEKFYSVAFRAAQKGLESGGIPIGSCLVIDNKVCGIGINKRIQCDSVIKHAEMDCLENAGRLRGNDYRNSTLYTTLSPCMMCAGAILFYRIKNVVIGENKNSVGEHELLKSVGVNVTILQDTNTINMMSEWISKNENIWNEDCGN